MPHINERCDITVQLWIVYQDRVLLRKHEKYDTWLAVGGHIDPGEDPLEAAHREAKEEVGLEVVVPGEPGYAHGDRFTELPPPRFMNRHCINDTHDHVGLEYFAIAKTDAVEQPDSHERTRIRWCTRKDLEGMDLSPQVQRYAFAALDVLGK